MSGKHALSLSVGLPKAVGEYEETEISLSFRLPLWSLEELNKMNDVAVRARRSNHALTVVTTQWQVHREEVLNLIVRSNSNALKLPSPSRPRGYDVVLTEVGDGGSKHTVTLTPERPTLETAIL
ncbi:hypothetical protein HY312_01885 [Candidatus Saccharibacteria bacterium]|nr:hypothetical protein [Candidatus Saccharibacteria bacterium]